MKFWALGVALALVLSVQGCRSACDAAATSSDNAPEVVNFDLFGQLDGDPWTLIFEIQFTDANGDLGGGRAEFFTQGSRSGGDVELNRPFLQAGLDLSAREGTIGIPLRFGEGGVNDGDSTRLGVQLVDLNGDRSNCFSLRLDFSVRIVRAQKVSCGGLLASLSR